MKYVPVSINKVKYKFYIPNTKSKIDKLIIICNGITTKWYERKIDAIIGKFFKKGYIVVVFDFIQTCKCRFIYKDRLCLYNFMKKLELISTFINEKYPNYEISMFSSGFGAYVALNSINEYNLKFSKIILNTPAINMREIFKIKLAKYNLIDLYKINPKRLNNEKMDQVKEFYNEIIEKDLLKLNNTFSNVYIIHDVREKVIVREDNMKFINNNNGCKFEKIINSDEEFFRSIIKIIE